MYVSIITCDNHYSHYDYHHHSHYHHHNSLITFLFITLYDNNLIIGRRNDVIRNRWKHVLSKQCWNDSSNKDMFCRIVMDVSNAENNNVNSSSSSSSSSKRSKFI